MGDTIQSAFTGKEIYRNDLQNFFPQQVWCVFGSTVLYGTEIHEIMYLTNFACQNGNASLTVPASHPCLGELPQSCTQLSVYGSINLIDFAILPHAPVWWFYKMYLAFTWPSVTFVSPWVCWRSYKASYLWNNRLLDLLLQGWLHFCSRTMLLHNKMIALIFCSYQHVIFLTEIGQNRSPSKSNTARLYFLLKWSHSRIAIAMLIVYPTQIETTATIKRPFSW